MIIDFLKTSPAQNTTVLVTSYCPGESYAKIAEKAMKYDFLHAEQVGFIVPPSKNNSIIRLEMAGGEFCGNATLSAAAYVRYRELYNGENFYIDVTGADDLILCKVEKTAAYNFKTSCTMPPPKENRKLELKIKGKRITGHIVEFDGISHFVFPTKEDFMEYPAALKVIKEAVNTNAIGIIPYKTLKHGTYEIKPFVHVKEINSSVFERGCGSGSLALGVYLNKAFGISKEIEVFQPGGVIRVGIGDVSHILTDVIFTCEGRMLI